MTRVSHSVCDLANRTFRRILLIKPSSLGDIVHALPVLHGLRSRFPEARIDWLISPSFASLLMGHQELDDLIFFHRKRYGQMGRDPRLVTDFVGFVQNLRRRRYDLAIDLQGLFRSGFITWASAAPVRIGFRHAREGAWVFYTHRVATDGPDMHAVDRNYCVADLLGFDEVPVKFNLGPSEPARAETWDLLQTNGITVGQRLVAVVPGARWATKKWLPDRFTATIDELHTQHGDLRCVLLGSRDEATLCEQVAAACRSRPVNLAGRTSLPQLSAVLALADAVLCHDSAAMHLAVALQRPLVCLVGPTNPLRTGPYHRSDDVLRAELECAPCYLRRLSQCRYDHRCMRELTVTAVVAAVEQALAPAAIPVR